MVITVHQNHFECPKCHEMFTNLFDLNYHAKKKHKRFFPIDQIPHHRPVFKDKKKKIIKPALRYDMKALSKD